MTQKLFFEYHLLLVFHFHQSKTLMNCLWKVLLSIYEQMACLYLSGL